MFTPGAGRMRSRFAPSVSNCATTEVRAARPKLTIAMNAATPIARPSVVSALRPGLRRGAASAICREGLRSVRMALLPVGRGRGRARLGGFRGARQDPDALAGAVVDRD